MKIIKNIFLKQRHILAISIFLIITSCYKQHKNISINDIKFVESINRKSAVKTIKSIDSIILHNEQNIQIKALLLLKKGEKYSNLQQYGKAIKAFKKALTIFKNLKLNKYIAKTHWEIGNSYIFLSNKKKAIEHLLKAQEINKKINNKQLIAKIYQSLAHIHSLFEDYEKAIDYMNKALIIQKKLNDSSGISASYNNIAIIYRNITDFDNALVFNRLSLSLNKKLKNKRAIAKSYNNIGLVYDNLHEFDKAIYFFKKAIRINDSLQNSNSSPLQNLAELYLKKENLEKSEFYYLKALKKSKGGKTETPIKIYDKLLKIALKNKDFEKSLLYREKHDSLQFLQNKRENEEKLLLLKDQYLLTKNKSELEKEKHKNIITKIIFSMIIVFFIAIIIFSVQYNRTKHLKNNQERLRLEQQVLRSQMNPHFIFNALSAIQNTLLDNDPVKSATFLSKFAKLIRQNFDFINQKKISLRDELDSLQNYMETQKFRLNNKFDYEINLHPDIDLDNDSIPPLLLQPFIENSIEHGFKNIKHKGIITIIISKENNKICYKIQDNGKGFSDCNKSETKIHAIDILKKRLSLLKNKKNKINFSIKTSKKGTIINFCLSYDKCNNNRR